MPPAVTPSVGRILPRGVLLVAGSLAVSAALSGCTGAGQEPAASTDALPTAPVTSAPPSTSATSSPSASASSSPRGSGSVTLQQAMALALKAEKGDVVGAELDRFGEGAAWRVDVRRSRQVTVEVALTTTSGDVLARTEDDTDDEAATVPDSTARRAVDAAEDRVEGGQATQVELDTEDGDDRARVWQVTVRRAGAQPVEVIFDADSGRFVRQQSD